VIRFGKAARVPAVLLAAVVAAQAHAETWRSIQDQSTLEFMVDYEGAAAPGRFDRFEVLLSVDPATGKPGDLQVSVDTTSAGMGSTDIDDAVAAPEWFDSRSFPRASFRSDNIQEHEDLGYAAEGVVSIKGVDRPLTVPFHWRTESDEAEMTGSVILSRLDFGIGTGEWASGSPIGTQVEVRFTVTLKPE